MPLMIWLWVLAAIDLINSQGADGVRSAIQQVGPTCGACHDAYRAE
ncbi:cytochrome c [Haliea sp. AH-315-K21]|nr:cytochrome c [Haliea sp. AH-315-K21]